MGKYSKYNLQKIQKRQNRAAQILTGSSYDVPITDLMRQLNWQTLEERIVNKKALLMCIRGKMELHQIQLKICLMFVIIKITL